MTEKRRRGLVAALTADPWRKLLAITLAVMSWFFVDSRITRTIVRTVPLVFVGGQIGSGATVDRLAVALPTDRVSGLRFLDGEREIHPVDVEISGPRFRVTEIENRPLDLQIIKFLTADWRARTGVEFTAQDLRDDQLLLKDLEIGLSPARIRIEVETLGEHRFPMSLNTVEIVAGSLEGRLQYDDAEFAPDTALVRGPAIALERLAKRTGKMFRVTLAGGSNDRTARGQVELVDAADLTLTAPTLLTMPLRPVTLKIELEVPIAVDDLALPPELQGLYLPETRTRKVWVLAGGDLRTQLMFRRDSPDKGALQEFVSANLRLHVYVPRLRPGTHLGPEIEHKARLLLLGDLAATVERNECLLDELVLVKLKRAP
jgi:hypothetical protein